MVYLKYSKERMSQEEQVKLLPVYLETVAAVADDEDQANRFYWFLKENIFDKISAKSFAETSFPWTNSKNCKCFDNGFGRKDQQVLLLPNETTGVFINIIQYIQNAAAVSARIHCPVQIRQASVALLQSVCTLHFPSASLLQLHSCLPFRSTVSFLFSFIFTTMNYIKTKNCTYSALEYLLFIIWIFSDDLKAIVSAVSNGDVSYLYGLSPAEFLLIAQNYLSGSFQLTEVTYFTLLLFILLI